jgi:hypothetical protein
MPHHAEKRTVLVIADFLPYLIDLSFLLMHPDTHTGKWPKGELWRIKRVLVVEDGIPSAYGL